MNASEILKNKIEIKMNYNEQLYFSTLYSLELKDKIPETSKLQQ